MADPYLAPSDLRAVPPLDNSTRFPDSILEELVAEVEEIVERECGAAFVTREATFALPGNHTTKLVLPHPLVSSVTAVSVDGTALTSDELDALTVWSEAGVIERPAGWCATQVTGTYEHGTASMPAGLARATREYVRARALKQSGNQPRDAAGPAGVDGTTYPVAATKPTGVRTVDAIIATLPHYRTPGIG